MYWGVQAEGNWNCKHGTAHYNSIWDKKQIILKTSGHVVGVTSEKMSEV
jgi:hypothetical protein